MSSGRQSRCKDCTKEAAKRSYRSNPMPTIVRASERNRELSKRIPPWANLANIRKIYRDAQEATNSTGVQHHVDHILPIKSKVVCGLHTEANLQILTAEDNMKKSNHLLEEYL